MSESGLVLVLVLEMLCQGRGNDKGSRRNLYNYKNFELELLIKKRMSCIGSKYTIFSILVLVILL